jgi:hypothetical protein
METLLNEAGLAYSSEGYRTAADKYLELVLASPSVWFEARWGIFFLYKKIMLMNQVAVTQHDITTLRTKFVENVHEPMFYRAQAASLLGVLKMERRHEYDDVVWTDYMQQVATFCDGASRSERNRIISTPDTDPDSFSGGQIRNINTTVGEKLDRLKSAVQRYLDVARNYQADPHEFILQTMLKSTEGDDRPFAEEMIRSIFNTIPVSPEDVFRPPAITSGIIEQVKSLPQEDVSVLVYHAPQVDDPSNRQRGTGLEGCPVFKVFILDLARWRASRTSKVFEQMKVVFCDPKEVCAKHLIGAFAAACLKPFVFMPGTPQPRPSFRPATVFFETTQDANHPQLKSFLSMMGCSDLRVIDPGAKHLLEITMQDVLNDSGKHIFNKQDFPHIYDYNKGRVCGNCGMTGSVVMQVTPPPSLHHFRVLWEPIHYIIAPPRRQSPELFKEGWPPSCQRPWVGNAFCASFRPCLDKVPRIRQYLYNVGRIECRCAVASLLPASILL